MSSAPPETAPPADQREGAVGMRVDVKRVLKNYGILFAFVLVCAILAWLSPVFLRWNNILNVIRQSSIYGIMAVGMTFVILTGGIDLSVGSILAVAGALAAGMLKAGAALPWVVLVALAVGATIGLANRGIGTGGPLTPVGTTLGKVRIRRSLTLIYCQGYPISGFNPQFRYIGGGDLLGIPFPIVVFLLTVILAAVILSETRLGRDTYAVGGHGETGRLSGVRPNFYQTMGH